LKDPSSGSGVNGPMTLATCAELRLIFKDLKASTISLWVS
jgi:hypothetical protein